MPRGAGPLAEGTVGGGNWWDASMLAEEGSILAEVGRPDAFEDPAKIHAEGQDVPEVADGSNSEEEQCCRLDQV